EKRLAGEYWPDSRELLYQVDAAASISRGGLVLNLSTREPKRGGGWKQNVTPNLNRGRIPQLPNPVDRQILELLSGCVAPYDWSLNPYKSTPPASRLLDRFATVVMPLAAGTGRCVL